MFNNTEYQREWRKRHPNYYKQYHHNYYSKNREKILIQKKCYYQTEKGILAQRKAAKKRDARRERDLNWIPLFENPLGDLEKVDWHHITDIYVVALPKDLHRLYLGKYHRENTMEIIKQIY